jgi:hypothetical protein
MDKEQSRLEPQGRRMGDNNDDDDLWWWEVVVVVVVLGKKMREGSNHQPPRNVTLHSPMASSWEFQTLASHKLKQRVRRNRILESCNMVWCLQGNAAAFILGIVSYWPTCVLVRNMSN